MARNKKPFDKILAAKNTLAMYVQFGETALQGRSFEEFATDLNEAFEYLLTFRNMVNSMVSFDDTPEQSVLIYLPADLLADQ